jgi:hypothetical protein
MAADERGARYAGWPIFTEIWTGDTMFPTGRGHQQATTGWTCPGCQRGFSPAMRECPYCPEGSAEQPAFIGKTAVPVMGEWGEET